MKDNVCMWNENQVKECKRRKVIMNKKYKCPLCEYSSDLSADIRKHQTHKERGHVLDWCKRLKYINNQKILNVDNNSCAELNNLDESVSYEFVEFGANEGTNYQDDRCGNVVTEILENDINAGKKDKNNSVRNLKMENAKNLNDIQAISSYEMKWEPPGFINTRANMCFMNSILQTLFHNNKFTSWLSNYFKRHDGYCYVNCKLNMCLFLFNNKICEC